MPHTDRRGWRFLVFDDQGAITYRSPHVYPNASAAEAAGLGMLCNGDSVIAVRNFPGLELAAPVTEAGT